MTTIGMFFRGQDGQEASAMGFHHPVHDNEYSSIYVAEKGTWKHVWHNLAIVGSWIPGIAMISGIYFKIKSNHFEKMIPAKVNGQIPPAQFDKWQAYTQLAYHFEARAIATFCQASVLLMIVDLVASAIRFFPLISPEQQAWSPVE